jgi:hypothetical protein
MYIYNIYIYIGTRRAQPSYLYQALVEQIKAARMHQSFEMEMLKEQVPWGGYGEQCRIHVNGSNNGS